MPTWMRKFHLKKIQKFFEDQAKEQEKYEKQNSPSSKPIMGPNIGSKSTYNFKK